MTGPALRHGCGLAVLLQLLLCGAGSATAQQCGELTQTFLSFTVTPAALALPQPAVSEFNQGWSQTAQYSIYIQPSVLNLLLPWHLCVRATSSNLGTSGVYTKPLADLQWSLNGTTWQSVTTTLQPILSNQTGIQTVVVRIRVLLRYADDIPGSYSGNLSFRVAH